MQASTRAEAVEEVDFFDLAQNRPFFFVGQTPQAYPPVDLGVWPEKKKRWFFVEVKRCLSSVRHLQ